MAVGLLHKNYNTDICRFSFDTWDSDQDKLPTLDSPGKDALSVVISCRQGSMAIGTNGDKYVLTGDNNWIKYNAQGGSGTSGDSEEIQAITDEEINSLFS